MAIVAQALIDHLATIGRPGVWNDWMPDTPDDMAVILCPTGDLPQYVLEGRPAISTVQVQLLVRGAPRSYDSTYPVAQGYHHALRNLTELPSTVVVGDVTYSLLVTLRATSGLHLMERDSRERCVFQSLYEAHVVEVVNSVDDA